MRAIKRERDLTPAGENVKINIRKLTNRDEDAPAMDTVRKCIRLLESQGAFNVAKKYIDDPSEVYDPVDASWERATSFELAINQETFDLLYKISVEDPVGPIDMKSDDATYFKEREREISAIKHPEDHKLVLSKWLEIKAILDAIDRQLSPMKGNNQTVNLDLRQTHKNISQSVLDDLQMRGICGYGGSDRSPDWERFNYLRGSLIEIRDLPRFTRYCSRVSDFVNWIKQDATTRFSTANPSIEIPSPRGSETQPSQARAGMPFRSGKSLKSIYLITDSIAASKAIFLVLDERFEAPIRREVRNKKGGDTFIKKLYDIAYFVDAPGKKVPYEKNLASDINNALFRIPQVGKYMMTNGFDEKPTLVQKSRDDTLVLKNEIVVKTGLIRSDVPSQYQSLYIDKTK